MMRARLGDVHWAAFVRHTNRHYKATFVNAFRRRVLRCVGSVDGAPCPHEFKVGFTASAAAEQLEPFPFGPSATDAHGVCAVGGAVAGPREGMAMG